MRAHDSATLRPGHEALRQCGADEEAMRPQRVFNEHDGVLDHRAEI
jgi:hypothetical protein